MNAPSDIHHFISDMKAKGKPFAVATVVRTLAVTAAKAGAKAVIDADGNITEGWIGGGCAKGAVLKAAKLAIEKGEPKLVSLLPKDLVGDAPFISGVQVATNMCPSQGTMDIFVEPVLPPAQVVILGNSPVALALEDIAARFGFQCELLTAFEGSNAEQVLCKANFVIVSTQGSGDAKALAAALDCESHYVAFVGSRKKTSALRDKLEAAGLDATLFEKLKAPAGLDIGAITPDEIALSIVAEMIKVRRHGQRENV